MKKLDNTSKQKAQINYKELKDWLACPNCQSRDAKLEKGSIQLFCPNCKERQELIVKKE